MPPLRTADLRLQPVVLKALSDLLTPSPPAFDVRSRRPTSVPTGASRSFAFVAVGVRVVFPAIPGPARHPRVLSKDVCPMSVKDDVWPFTYRHALRCVDVAFVTGIVVLSYFRGRKNYWRSLSPRDVTHHSLCLRFPMCKYIILPSNIFTPHLSW